MAATHPVLDVIFKPWPTASYTVTIPLDWIEHTLNGYRKDFGLNLEPEFQRGHVWTPEQQERYVHALLSQRLNEPALTIEFNAPHWENSGYAGELPREIQCLDGLQRLTAVRRFLAGDLLIEGLSCKDLEGTRYSINRSKFYLRFSIHEFQTLLDLLTYYLDKNDGGTPHSPEEIKRIRAWRDHLRPGPSSV